MNRLKKIIMTSVLGLAMIVVPAVLPQSVSAVDESAKRAACEGIGAVGGDCGEGKSQINTLVINIVNLLSWIVGTAAVIMIIIGGFKYVTSNGDTNALSSAKSTIMYAIIGLVIAVFAQAIVFFVLRETAPLNPFSP